LISDLRLLAWRENQWRGKSYNPLPFGYVYLSVARQWFRQKGYHGPIPELPVLIYRSSSEHCVVRSRDVAAAYRKIAHFTGIFQGPCSDRNGCLSQACPARDRQKRIAKRRSTCEGPTSFVYLLRMQGGRLFKIGKSVDPVKRLEDISRGWPIEVTLENYRQVCCELHSFLAERKLHFIYKTYSKKGEWFLLPAREQTKIRKILNETGYLACWWERL